MVATRWEYQVVELNEPNNKAAPGGTSTVPWNDVTTAKSTLGRLGHDGWELVSAMPKADMDGCTRTVVMFLKRPMPTIG